MENKQVTTKQYVEVILWFPTSTKTHSEEYAKNINSGLGCSLVAQVRPDFDSW